MQVPPLPSDLVPSGQVVFDQMTPLESPGQLVAPRHDVEVHDADVGAVTMLTVRVSESG